MKLRNWDRYNLAYLRVIGLAVLTGSLLGFCVYVGTEVAMGSLSWAFSLLAGLGGTYTVLTAPRRATERAALNQAREAPSLAAAVTVHLTTTGSRNRTIITLRSLERELGLSLTDFRRKILLGFEPRAAFNEINSGLAASSVRRVLGHVVDRSQAGVEDEGEEHDSIVRHSAAMDETKTPIFIAVAFFAPIMFVLFGSMSHIDSAARVFAMMFLELVVLNMVFSFASADRSLIAQ